MDNDGYESDRLESNTESPVQDSESGESDANRAQPADPTGIITNKDSIEEPANGTGDTGDMSQRGPRENDTYHHNGQPSDHARSHVVTQGNDSDRVSVVGASRQPDTLRSPIIISANDLLKPGTNLKGRDQDEEDTLIETPRRNGSARFSIQRSVLDQKQFDENYIAGSRPSPTLKQNVKKQLSKCSVSGACMKDFLYTLFPFIRILKGYNVRTDIMGDVVSGLTVGIMHIPQGMAYGMLTTLPPVFGLYMSFFPVLIYFLFGSSKHISIGTFAVATLMIGSAVNKGYLKELGIKEMEMLESGEGSAGNQSSNGTGSSLLDDGEGMSPWELDIRLKYAMSITFMVGVVQLIMGLFRLGFVTVYLSDPLVAGFTTGAACHVFTSQIKHVFGITTKRYSGAFKLIYTYRDFFTNIPQTNYIAVIISVICMAILYCTSRFINRNPKLKPKMIMPVPTELIVVVLGTVISYAANLEGNHNVMVVSDIPTGLPVPNTNNFSRIPDVISDAIALAVVIFAISISMAKILAKKHDYEVNPNQELIAFGLSAVFSSFFSAPAPSASLSRSLVQEGVGGKTQITGLFSCCLLLVVLLAIGPYFRTLPNCILAATIIVALRGLFHQVFELPGLWRSSKNEFCVLASIIIIALRGMFLQTLALPNLWRVSKIDFCVWIVAFLGTVVLDVDLGLLLAVVFNILTVVYRSQRPYSCVLGQMQDADIYRDINVYKEARELKGLKIFRFENSLFFVNTEHFRTYLYKRTVNPRTISIARKKKTNKEEKRKKAEMLVLDEVHPDISIPDNTNDMEISVNVDKDDVKVVLTQETDGFVSIPPDVGFHTIILDCSSWSFIDSMAVKVLSAVIGEYKTIGVNVVLANCETGVREMFEKTNFHNTLENSRLFVSVHDAVLHAQARELQNQGNGHQVVLGAEPVDEDTADVVNETNS